MRRNRAVVNVSGTGPLFVSVFLREHFQSCLNLSHELIQGFDDPSTPPSNRRWLVWASNQLQGLWIGLTPRGRKGLAMLNGKCTCGVARPRSGRPYHTTRWEARCPLQVFTDKEEQNVVSAPFLLKAKTNLTPEAIFTMNFRISCFRLITVVSLTHGVLIH